MFDTQNSSQHLSEIYDQAKEFFIQKIPGIM